MKNNSISVVIPTHNRPDLLQKAIQSVFDQTLLPYELIVVDDGSEPAADESVFEGAPDGMYLHLLQNNPPAGAPMARNLGILKASGRWIAFLDDDDVFYPNKVEEVDRCIREHPDVDVIYHPGQIHMVGLNVTYYSKATHLKPGDDHLKTLYEKNVIGGTSMAVVRKQSLMEVNMFSQDLPALQDLDLWMKLAKVNARFHMIRKPLVRYYFYPDKKSITKNIDARRKAQSMIDLSFHADLFEGKGLDKNTKAIRQLRSDVYIAFLNMQRKTAFIQQLRLVSKTRSFKDLVLLMVIPFGIRWVYKLRSYV